MNKIMSFLSPYIPVGLAMKGLEKVSPKMKSFFGGALAAGYTANEAMDFLRNEFSSPGNREIKGKDESARPDELAAKARLSHEEMPSRLAQGVAATGLGAIGGAGAAALTGLDQIENQPANASQQPATAQISAQPPQQAQLAAQPQAASTQSQPPQGVPSAFMEFIKKHPELGNFITKEIQGGLSPIDAALTAKGEKKLKYIIDDIESFIGQPLENIIAQLFNMNMGQKPQGNAQNAQSTGQNTPKSGSNSKISQFIEAMDKYRKMKSGK
jgi:cytoskeletal protein RodZ